ncbi:MAG: apolipoprotein N-acyltransferase [Acidobacteria bacterium]|jgi:apolipoprotein N-acyltransferase|nr:apolipoprotein N-acyltransferase [Acidobacteriota bacterium]
MKFSAARAKLPSLTNSLLAILSAILLTLAFPDFDWWFFAWFALVPLFYAIEREKESIVKSFVLGWIFGTGFFFGSCWWLTFSFITYGGIPTPIAYFLLLIISLMVGFFPALFGAIFSLVLKRFGTYGVLSAPFLWTATEFLRFNLTGNNWNAIGYSQAFDSGLLKYASVGGVYLVSFVTIVVSLWLSLIAYSILYFYAHFFVRLFRNILNAGKNVQTELFSIDEPPILKNKKYLVIAFVGLWIFLTFLNYSLPLNNSGTNSRKISAEVIALQPNIPMSGLNKAKWLNLRQRHVELAEDALQKLNVQPTTDNRPPTTVIFPESPMNFMYERDEEFQAFIRNFARKHNVYVLFNSAEPNAKNANFYNSAIMVNPQGKKIGQYDKIHLVPFGEYAPVPSAVEQFVPTLVGNFQYGENYDLFPFGEARGGIMICYESHFASLSREFVKRGADVLIEMTNDGYLGNTPVLRQHLANAVFRAVETNRPVLRVTNVGVTAYVNERGEVFDAAQPYTEDTRVWTISKSDGKQTVYVRYGEWFAWLCSILSLVLLSICFWNRKNLTTNEHR